MEKYKYYLQDLVILLKERLEEAKKNQTLPVDDFNSGISSGIYTCLDIIKQQAIAFDIPLKEIHLDDINLEDYI